MEYKHFLINKEYKFDFNGNYEVAEKKVFNDGSDLIKIVIENKDHILSKKWLGLLSHYEVNLPLRDIFNISFKF